MRAMATVRRPTPAAKCERGGKYRASLPFFAAVDIERVLNCLTTMSEREATDGGLNDRTRAGDDYAFRVLVDRYEFQVAA